MMSRFEDMLRLYMRVNNISGRQLAKDLNMNSSTLHRILNGEDCQVSSVWSLLQWLADPLDPEQALGGHDE